MGRRTPGIIAAYPQDGEKNITEIYPISLAETEHLQTRTAVPYRAPILSDNTELIINRREQEQQASSLEPTSPWRKRRD